MGLKVTEAAPAQHVETPTTKTNPVAEDFAFSLRKLSTDESLARLHTLLDEITMQGKKISSHRDVHDLKQYRNLISSFMNEVVTQSHSFTRENFLDRRGRHRVYGIVRLVNKEVDELAQELLKVEKDPIKILERTDQIRGLLLDIIV